MRSLSITLLLAACAGRSAPDEARAPVAAVPVASAPAAPAPLVATALPPAAPPSSAAVTTGPQPPTPHIFPPRNVTPPFPRSAAQGDGVWQPFGDARAADGAPLLVTTTLHPHAESGFMTLTLVAIDRTRTELGFVPGVEDVAKLSVAFVPGLVPEAERPRVLAAFNGGFLPRHGRWGMRLGATTVLPPRDVGCTVLLLVSGDVRIAPWSSVQVADADIRALRQTPPCLVEGGAVHPQLVSGQGRAWGGKTPGIVTRRRSAIGTSADGRVLYYAVGVETSPKLLAQGLVAAGVAAAAQLDINWNWTRFFTFSAGPDGKLGVAESLVKVEHSVRDYVERASERDFFYVLRRRE